MSGKVTRATVSAGEEIAPRMQITKLQLTARQTQRAGKVIAASKRSAANQATKVRATKRAAGA